MKIDILGYILIVFVLIICIKIYKESDAFHLKCIVSGVDGNKYCVREREKLTLAADLLARVTTNMKKIVNHCGETFPDRENVNRLTKGFNPKRVNETLPTSSYTAYSENKGEKLAFCLNPSRESDKLIDENTLTFVAIHEIAHIMTKSVGHTQEFWTNFKFLLEIAVKLSIYSPVDYKKTPKKYCGMTITDSPYYDL